MFPLVCRGLGGDEASPSGELEKREKGKKTKSPPIAYTHADQKSFLVFLFPGQSHSAGAVSHAKALHGRLQKLGIAKVPNLSSVLLSFLAVLGPALIPGSCCCGSSAVVALRGMF